jgi:plastocyanin
LFLGGLGLHPSLGAQGSDVSGKITVFDESRRPLSDASNVVVFIDTVKDNSGFAPPSTHSVMASENMRFIPAVLPVLAGTTVDFPNRDIILHNVFSLSKTKTFDLGLYRQNQGKSVTFDKTGLVKVYCNIHQRMMGYILVLGNPYFALTDKEGKFSLKAVPSGTYALVCWYWDGRSEKEVIVTKIKTIKVGPDASGIKTDFELVLGKASSRHKNKWGKDYNDKY